MDKQALVQFLSNNQLEELFELLKTIHAQQGVTS